MRIICSLIVLLVMQGITLASSFYASPTGSGSGAIGSPFDFQTALDAVGTILPGDTLWLRDGIYSHSPQGSTPTASSCSTGTGNPGWIWRVTIHGNSSSQITIRSFPGEHARLDGSDVPVALANARPTIQVGNSGDFTTGSYVTLQDLEIFSSSTQSRNSPDDCSFPASITRSDGIYLEAPGDRVINCVIHDVTAGISSFGTAAIGKLCFGNLVYSVGWQGTPNAHGHGFYMQNQVASSGLLSVIEDNIVASAYQKGGQWYGSSAAQVSHLRWQHNLFMGTPGLHGSVQIGIRNGSPADTVQDNAFTNNWGYNAGLEVGHFQPDPIAYKDMLLANNYFMQGKFEFASFKQFTCTNNTFIYPIDIIFGDLSLITDPTVGIIPWTFDRNRYVFSSTGSSAFNHDGVGNYSLTTWRVHTGYDANSTVLGTVPSGTNLVTLYANTYDTNRASMLAYNWTLANFIALSTASLGWGPGSSVKAHNVQDYYGDIASLTVTSTNTLLLDMRAASHTVAIPFGDTAPLNAKSFPNFGSFVFELNGVAPPVITTTLTVNSTTPSSGVAISMSPADSLGASNGTTPFTRTPATNTVTTLIAPLASSTGSMFSQWNLNGSLFTSSMTATFTNNANQTLNAVFTNAPISGATTSGGYSFMRRGARL